MGRMKAPPLLDLLCQVHLWRDVALLEEIEKTRSAECASIRTVICGDMASGIDLDMGLGAISCPYIIPFFAGPRAFFLSAGTALQAHLTGGRSNVLIDYSLSFDSNFAENLRALMSGARIQAADRDRVVEVLTLKAQNPRVQFDITPFLFENTRLSRDNKENLRPLNTLVAFRALDHLNWDAWRDAPGHFIFDAPYPELTARLRPDAESVLRQFEKSEAVRQIEMGSLRTQALLLRFARLCYEKRDRDTSRILHGLLRFAIDRIGAIPLTEIRLIWSGLQGKEEGRFFGPIFGRSRDMLVKIRGMAWDMSLLRLMEGSALTSRNGSFFVPYFVSIDGRWRALLRQSPVTLMLADDNTSGVIFARAGELEFQTALAQCLHDMHSDMTTDKVEARRRAALAIRSDVMQRLVAEEERYWTSS
jgi:hypothetical protein